MHILLLYIARTSSSYIWQLFKGIKDVKIYGEIMNGPEKYLRPLGAKDKIIDLQDDEDVSYHEFAKKKLPEYLKFLENSTKEPFYFTKVSLVHIFGLIKSKNPKLREILKDENTKVIVLQRNLIDTYISLKKVGITNRWRELDTTDLKIEIDNDDFLDYYERMTMLYRNIFELLGDKDYLLLSYEELHGNSGEKSDLEKVKYVIWRIKKELGVKLELDKEHFTDLRLMFKQDKNLHHSEKITNYKSFLKFLEKNKLKFLID